MPRAPETRDGLREAARTVEALRSENGCPWDKEQTHESLRRYLLEEAYETLEAIDSLGSPPSKAAAAHLQDELGDLLLQVLLHAEIARQNGLFSIDDVAGGLSDKLKRRHPHVFGESKLSTPEEVAGAWEKIKQTEKAQERESLLDGVPPSLPALQRALKLIEKVSRVGFQWPDLEGPLGKIREEVAELEEELRKAGGAQGGNLNRERARLLPEEARRKLEAELGDLLFTVANAAYFLHVNPEDALRSMLRRFERRFQVVEKGAREAGKRVEELSLAEMDIFWETAKREES